MESAAAASSSSQHGFSRVESRARDLDERSQAARNSRRLSFEGDAFKLFLFLSLHSACVCGCVVRSVITLFHLFYLARNSTAFLFFIFALFVFRSLGKNA